MGMKYFKTAAVSGAGNLPPAMPPELEPVDWWPDYLFNADGLYLYGRSVSNPLDFVRIDKVTRARTLVANPFGAPSPQQIRTVVKTSVPGLIFATVGQSSQTAVSMVVWRSTDYGTTWAQVLQLGSAGGGTINGVWMLSDRNFAEGVLGWYIAEYNVNSARTPGGANDAVTVWKSTDNGATWAAKETWNTGGRHQVRHLHFIKKVSTGVLICTGDTDAESALILWDEVSPIGNIAYANLTVPMQYGTQRTRAVEIIETDDGQLHWMGDGPSDSNLLANDVGWFSMPSDMSAAPRRLDGQIAGYIKRDVYFGAKFNNGSLAFIEELTDTPAAGFFHAGIWVTNAKRTRMERVGRIQLSTVTTGAIAPHMFQDGENCYAWIDGTALAKAGTCVFTVSASKQWNGITPDAVHPVYWLDPVNGVDNADTNRGWSPALPWKTLSYAFASSRMTQGGRLVLPAGEFSTTELSQAVPSFATAGAEVTDYLTIDGQGISKTKIGLSASSAAAAHIYYSFTTAARLEVKDLWLTTYRAVSGQSMVSAGGTSAAQSFRLNRARVGTRDLGLIQVQPVFGNLQAGGSLTVVSYASQLVARAGATGWLVSGDADGPINWTGTDTIFDGGAGAFNPKAADTITLTGGMICSFGGAGIQIESTATKIPVLKGVRIASTSVNPQLVNNSAVPLAGQWSGCTSANPFNPPAVYDATSKVDARTAPRDPTAFDYAAS